jgi:initiation factor 1A
LLLIFSHLQVLATNGKILKAKISGVMRKRKWINIGDIILVSSREFETNQDNCDILYCYDYDEAKNLISLGEISFDINNKIDDIKFADIDLELNESDESDNDTDELPINNNHTILIKTGKDIKSRNNKRDDKLSRIENFTHEDI